MVKSIEDLIKGFQELLNFLKKGWDEIKRIIDDAFEAFQQLRKKEILGTLEYLVRILKNDLGYRKCLNLVFEKSFFKEWMAEELEAMIKYYTSEIYKTLNNDLRTKTKLDKKTLAMKSVLDKALDSLPVSEHNDNPLFRSAKFSEDEIRKFFKEGQDFTEKGFMSTTYSDEALQGWLRINEDHNVIFKVLGKNGKLIEEVSLLPHEAEVLFKSNTAFAVESVEKMRKPGDSSKEIFEIILKEN